MPIQKQVNIYYEIAKAGTRASHNPIYFYPNSLQATENGVLIAHFCWMTAIDGVVANIPLANEKPLGLIYGELSYPILNIQTNSSITIPAGYTVDVVQKGDLWVISESNVIAGQKVFANIKDGSIIGATAGSTMSDYIETDFSILKTTVAGTPFIIQNL